MSLHSPLGIEPATERDIPLILKFIRELAQYEKAIERVVATEEVLHRSLFGPTRYAEAILAYQEGAPVAFAIYYYSFSSFMGVPGLYLEDIFVKPEARGQGLGRELFAFLARQALQRGCGRMEWAVLNWNKLAIDFYESLGAEPVSDWTVFHLTKDKLAKIIE